MKKEYYSPEVDIEIFRISSSIHTSGFGWEEEPTTSKGDENPWG